VVLAVATFAHGVPTRDVPVASNSLHRIYGSADLAERFAPFAVSVVNAADGLTVRDRLIRGIPAAVSVLVLRK
jgi:hypothetical protein